MSAKKRGNSKRKNTLSIKLKNANPENYFILVTGVPLKNLKELVNSLEIMNDWVFKHHVNETRNDFSEWIKNVLDEKHLAEEIRNIRDIRELEIKVLKYMVNKYI
ncbi:hypothetical protein JXB41_05495 [Candidatus Woesearchaeota archaeon]|nr:hypothetical protein [Candidatus Woesearchaeota archaeon]